MPLWTKDSPPKFHNPGHSAEAVATERGWEDPVTGEVLVAISNLATKAGAGDVRACDFTALSYLQSDNLSVLVTFNEKVDVVVGASITVNWSGTLGNFTLNAAAQTNVRQVLFNKQPDNTTQEVVPAEPGTLSFVAQTISGTITDNVGGAATNLAISAPQASAAGTRVVS